MKSRNESESRKERESRKESDSWRESNNEIEKLKRNFKVEEYMNTMNEKGLLFSDSEYIDITIGNF